MSFSDIVTLRQEVLRKDGMGGVIDIGNCRDQKRKSIESRPNDYFDLTYPTTNIRQVIEHLDYRFNTSERSPGLFLIEGYKGTVNPTLNSSSITEGNYFFDEQEKPNAKVEYRSLRIDPTKALDFALDQWKTKLFCGDKTVVFRDAVQTNTALSGLESNSLRFVLPPRRLSADERAEIYRGIENRKQVILLEPKSDTFDALDNPEITKWAQRVLAAEELQKTASDSERRKQYERIAREDLSYILEAFKKAGLVFVWIQPNGGTKGEFFAELEALGNAVTRDDVLRQLQENIFPRQRFEEHLSSRITDILNKTVREVDADCRKTLGFPVRTADAIFSFRGRAAIKHTVTAECR